MSLLVQSRELRSLITKDFDNARVLFWVRSAEQSISDHSYEVATRRLVSGALLFLKQQRFNDQKERYANLLLAVALRSESVKAVAEGASLARQLSAKADCSGLGELESKYSHRFLIAQIVVSEFPENAFARIQLADYADRANHPRKSVAALFQQAVEMEEGAWLELRTGVALVHAGLFSDGRKYLRGLKRDELSERELLWLVGGLSRTQKWLDRLRAFDILIDLHRSLALEKYTERELSRKEWSGAFFDFLNSLPVELNVQEQERYEEESNIFDEAPRKALVESLLFRSSLESESANLDSLAELILPTPMSEIALALRFEDAEMLKSNCETLARMCRTEPEEVKGIPVAILWPFLLKKELELEQDVVTDIAKYFAENARTPSYGWAALSAKFFKLKYPDAGISVAKSMLRDNEKNDLRSKLIQSSLKRSLELDDEKELLFWLDAFNSATEES